MVLEGDSIAELLTASEFIETSVEPIFLAVQVIHPGHPPFLKVDTWYCCPSVYWLSIVFSSELPVLRFNMGTCRPFFSSLYRCLARGARVVLQFYADNEKQSEMIVTSAMRAGFAGGVVFEWPRSSTAKKSYLFLTCGPPSVTTSLPRGKGENGEVCSDDDDNENSDEDGDTTAS